MQLSKDFINDGDTRLLTTMQYREDKNPLHINMMEEV